MQKIRIKTGKRERKAQNKRKYKRTEAKGTTRDAKKKNNGIKMQLRKNEKIGTKM